MTLQTFTASGTFTVPAGVTSIDVLVVGGGGRGGCVGGGTHGGGGGGAGRVRWVTGLAVTPGQTCPVVVGAGGVDDVALNANAGGASQITVPTGGTAYSAAGGGYGGFQGAGGPGGSGGGGGSFSGANQVGGTASAGNNGGTGFSSATTAARAGGGGGGAGAVGGNAATNVGGAGGAGVDMSAQLGTGVGVLGWFGGGGGGGGQPTPGAGGQGGGGAATATAGTANTGGGGGGARGAAPQRGAAGGSGVVIVRYTALVAPNVPTSLAVDPDETTADVTWVAPVGGSVVTGYEYRLDGGAAVDVGLTLGTTLVGLTASTAYDVEVRSYNAAGASSWVGPESFTTDDPPPPPPPGYYRVELSVGDYSWEASTEDSPTYGPQLPLTLGWSIPDGVDYFPAQQDLTTMTFPLLVEDASDLADLNVGDPVSFVMFVDDELDAEPWQQFKGVVTQLDGRLVRAGEGSRWQVTVYAADELRILADNWTGYTSLEWPIESIQDRLERVCANVGVTCVYPFGTPDGMVGWLAARAGERPIDVLSAIRTTLADASSYNDSELPDEWYGRWVYSFDYAALELTVFPFERRVYPGATVTLDGCLVDAIGSWSKLPGDPQADWVIVDGTTFGTVPTVGGTPPKVRSTSLLDWTGDPPGSELNNSATERDRLGESLLPDGSTQLGGWYSRQVTYRTSEPGADLASTVGWASGAHVDWTTPHHIVKPIVVTPLDAAYELNGVDYLAGTLTGARLVIPTDGRFRLELRLRPELLPGTDLP